LIALPQDWHVTPQACRASTELAGTRPKPAAGRDELERPPGRHVARFGKPERRDGKLGLRGAKPGHLAMSLAPLA